MPQETKLASRLHWIRDNYIGFFFMIPVNMCFNKILILSLFALLQEKNYNILDIYQLIYILQYLNKKTHLIYVYVYNVHVYMCILIQRYIKSFQQNLAFFYPLKIYFPRCTVGETVILKALFKVKVKKKKISSQNQSHQRVGL